MQREDFIFTIGYRGGNAVVDKKLRAKYFKLDTIQLYEQGLLKPAAASAIYALENGRPSDLAALSERFQADFGEELDEKKLRRIYGIARGSDEKVFLL